MIHARTTRDARPARRHFLQLTAASIALAGRSSLLAEDQPQPVFEAVELNHLSLDVTHMVRSQEFYQSVFGLTPVDHGRGQDKFMHFQEGFINMRPADHAGMNHYCYSIKEFDGNYTFQMLDLAGTEPFRMGGRNTHCFDPDRFNVQVQEEQHGWGRINGSQLTNADQGLFKTIRLHHVSLKVTDVNESRGFYQEMFGLKAVDGGKSSDRLRLSVGPHAHLELQQADEPGMDHFCLTVEDFDLNRLPDSLEKVIKGKVDIDRDHHVARFKDPQGIVVEVTG